MKIGPYQLPNRLVLAPMAGISDRPFRQICKQFGAGFAVSEMVASNPILRNHKATLLKADHMGEPGFCSVQIVGTNPDLLAEAAVYNVQRGAKIIDINMGCPAKKVCAVAAGSALLRDPDLVKRILDKVVNAVSVPVTLKIRTGWDKSSRNAVDIAAIAESAGIAALTVHGRTRACKFEGEAEYETIKRVKQTVKIPVIANGDIDSAEKAEYVLKETGVDALMIGRAAQGNPWLFETINAYLNTGHVIDKPSINVIFETVLTHLEKLYGFYGELTGVRMARKHLGWYFKQFDIVSPAQRIKINQATGSAEQFSLVCSVLSL